MAKRKTKNHIKYKKKYIDAGIEGQFAPYVVSVKYDGYESDLDVKLIELAERNSGVETGSGFGFGERDISFDFFTAKGVKSFVKKANDRYSYKFNLETLVQRPNVDVTFEEVDVNDL